MIVRKLLLAALLLALLGQAGPAGAQGGSGWEEVPGMPTFVDVFGVEKPVEMDLLGMADAYNGWGVSMRRDFNAIYRLAYRDGRWTAAADGGTPGGLAAIAAVSAEEAWILSESGYYRRGPAGWKLAQPASKDDPIQIYDIEMSRDGASGWAAGKAHNRPDEAVLLAYRDGRWQREPSVSGPGVIGDVAIDQSSGTGWAVGESLWRYASGSWTRAAQPDLCAPASCAVHWYRVQSPSEREAWALACVDQCAEEFVVRYRDGAWTKLALDRPADGDLSLSSLAVNRYGAGLLTGSVRVGGRWQRAVMYRLAGDQWVAEPPPVTEEGEPINILLDLFLLDTGHALVSSYNGLWEWGYAKGRPSDPAADPGRPDVLYFDVTRHTLRGSLRAAWERDGGLPVFGYPLTEQFAEANPDTGVAYATQYLERQRFEYHPELAGTPFEVLLGRLGVEALAAQGRDYRGFPKADPAAPHYFAATGQAIAPEFWDYWRGRGLDLGEPGVTEGEALALFGYPISPARVETNPDGHQVLTQWFERARFEYHPANPPGQRVLLGRLGAEELARRGWIGR